MKVLTWNVHSCVGRDRATSPERIAEVIAGVAPDVVALQEVDVHRGRTGHVDQADTIARALGMASHFNSVLRVEDREGYGDAIMSALPMTLKRAALIPGAPRIPGVERRGALWVGVEYEGRQVQVITTHLGLSHAERHEQLDALLGEGWLGHPECTGPRILLGDFNAIPPSRAYRRMARAMHCAQRLAGERPRATFPSGMPFLPLDHVFVDIPGCRTRTRVIRTKLARIASDHLPVLTHIEFPAGGDAAAAAR